MLKRIPKLLILLPLLLLLAACAQRAQKGATGNTDTLAGLLSLHAPEGNEQSATNETTGRIREMALKETALSPGAQAALASRAKVIDEALNKISEQERASEENYLLSKGKELHRITLTKSV